MAPVRLSAAQQITVRKQGGPDEVRKNDHGGLDWIYRRAQRTPEAPSQALVVFSFDARGLLVGQTTEVRYKERPQGPPPEMEGALEP